MPFGAEQALAAQQQQQAPQPLPAAPDPRVEFIKSLAAAAAANVRAERPNQRGLINLFTGRDADAAAQAAKVNGPMAYDQQQQSDTTTKSGQLGLAQTFQLLRNLGMNVNPDNISASYGGNQGNPSAPVTVTPSQTATGTAPSDIASRRMMFLRLGKAMSMLPAFAQQGAVFMKMAQDGLPTGTLPTADGGVGDAVTGQPITADTQAYAAQGAGKIAAADTAPRVAGQMAVAGNQAGLDRETAREANFDKNRYDTVDGFDKTTGQPVSVSRTALANGQAPNFVAGKNPYFDGQQAELKELRTSADSADNGLNLASQLVGAANGLYTGKGSASLQSARKLAQSAAALTGTKLPDSLNNDTSKFEQLQFASQQLVAAASHDLSPRVAQQIYNQIAAVKPGDKSSIKVCATSSRTRSCRRSRDARLSTVRRRNTIRAIRHAMTRAPCCPIRCRSRISALSPISTT